MRRIAFIAAVGLQLVILALVPAKKVKAYYTGREIKLATAQYDPYDVMKGHYVALSYEINERARFDVFRAETSPPRTEFPDGRRVYMILAVDAAGIARPVRVAERAADIRPGEFFIAGTGRRWWIEYGLERFYMPEERRDEINAAIAAARGDTDALLGVVRLDADGDAVLTALEIRGKRYEY